jgi:predicted dehydrogenase
MRALVVGLGSIGRRHARNLASLGLEVAVCRQVGAAQPEPLGVNAREFSSLRDALAAEPDVVIVTNPTSLHVDTALKAIEAGAHVLVEKPIGHTLDAVASFLESAREKKRVISVGYNLRFHPGLARLRELLYAGDIGRPLTARIESGEFLPGWHPWEDYRHGYSARRDMGGGPVLTFSHEIDTLLWLLGRPVRLTALAARTSDLEIDTEDVAEIVVQLACGALAAVHVDYVRRPPRRVVEIVGDAGVLRWEYDENRLLQYAPITGAWRVEEGDPRFERNDMYTAEVAHFLQAVQEGGAIEPLSTGEEGAAVLTVALAALRSAAEGKSIELTTQEEPRLTWLRSFDRPVPSGE